MRARSAQRLERLVTAAGASPRLASPPPPSPPLLRLVCGEWRDSLIKFETTSGASDKGQFGPPRPQPNSPGAASAGSRRALRTSRAPLSVLLPVRPGAAEGGGAAPRARGEGRGVYTRVDEMMARDVCARGGARKEAHLCVPSSSREGSHLSGSSQPKNISGLRPQGRAFWIGTATLRQTQFLERAMWGVEAEDKEITVCKLQESREAFRLKAPLLSLTPRVRASTCKFGAAECMQGKAGEGGAGPQGNQDLWP